MNPVIKLGLVLFLSLEIAFVPSLSLNLGLIMISFIYLLIKKIHWQALLYLLFIPLIPAIGVLITQILYGAGVSYGTVLSTRIYAYVLMGAGLMISTTALQMTYALEENCHLPSKFAFGILSALNLIPQIIYQVKIIKMAAEMHGIHLTWFSPTLYFKAILTAIQWADQLANAMISHGFVENAPRTYYYQVGIHSKDWVSSIGLFIIIQALVLI